MIDTHCHILPNCDDGPKTSEGSLRMAQAAVKQGIHTIIATPHHGTRNYSNTAEQIQGRVKMLNQELQRLQIPVKVLPGQEYRLSEFYRVEYEAGRLQTLGDTSLLLVELPSSKVPKFFMEFIRYMKRQEITVIIAHPERNLGVLRRPDRLQGWIKAGVLLQVTSQSLVGVFGSKVQKMASLICGRQWAYLLASDAHNTLRRSFYLKEGYRQIEKSCGSAYVNVLQCHAEKFIQR